MAVFVSYSSRDRALLDGLLAALRRAHEQVWLDEELGGGETWWRAILEQIRGCEVFIVALSKNMLESKACQAELGYAQELGKAILPVQVGPLDNMRINPLAQMQVIDYRDPGIESGIELVSSVHARRAKSTPLPDPLPDEPPIPFAYLMRLASTISGPSLSAQQQTTLVAELKAGLEEDGDDASARRDLTQLLCMLRDRSDVTWRTRSEVEAVLASLESPEPAPMAGPVETTGPHPVYTTGPHPVSSGGPPPSPPPPEFHQQGMQPPWGPPGFGFAAAGPGGGGRASKSRNKWLIAGGAVAAVIIAVVAVVVVVTVSGDDTNPTPPSASPPPTVAAAALSSLLLTTGEITSIMGSTSLNAQKVQDQMLDSPPTLSNPDCAAAQSNAIEAVYEGSGYSTVLDQAFRSEDNTDDDYVYAQQTAVAFPSDDQASAFLSTTTDKWKDCAGQTVTRTQDDGDEYNWTFDSVSEKESQIAQRKTQEGMGGYACQHVMRTVLNVVIETMACSDHVTDEASRMADEMAAKAPA